MLHNRSRSHAVSRIDVHSERPRMHWRVPLCASKWRGESRLQPIGCAADCGDGLSFTRGGNCTRCSCRGCAHCHCTDMLGREMAAGVCSKERARHKDVLLGHFHSASQCAHACNNLMQRPANFDAGVECSAWTFASRRCIGHIDLAIFTAGWQPPGLVHGVASCAAPSPHVTQLQLPPPSRFVLVHTVGAFACTPGVIARISRAYAQFAATNHMYAPVLVSRAPPVSVPCRFYEPGYYEPGRNCSASRRAIVKEDATAFAALARATRTSLVRKVSEAVAQRVLGHHLLRRMGRIRWSDRRAPLWLSAGCDLPGIVWFAQMRAAGRLDASYQHVWVVQHDVGWTGELPAILERFDPAPDLLCDGLGHNPNWVHFGEHNHLHRDGIFSCLLPATRYSPRLLDDQVLGLQAGNTSYCEIRAASACAKASWPCKAAELRGRGLLGPFSAHTSVDERALLPTSGTSSRSAFSTSTGNTPIWVPEQCGTRPDQPPQPGRLFHRVYDHRDKKRSRFADCPDLCYSDWPRPGRSPPPPPAALINSGEARSSPPPAGGKGFQRRSKKNKWTRAGTPGTPSAATQPKTL